MHLAIYHYEIFGGEAPATLTLGAYFPVADFGATLLSFDFRYAKKHLPAEVHNEYVLPDARLVPFRQTSLHTGLYSV